MVELFTVQSQGRPEEDVGAGVQVSSCVVKNHNHIKITRNESILCEIDTEIARGPALTAWSASGQNVFLADVIAGVF